MDGAGWSLLAVCTLAAGFYVFAHHPFTGYLPGIGLAVTHWILTMAAMLFARQKGRLRIRGNARGVFLLALSLLLGACYGIFCDNMLRLMNLPVLMLLSCQTLMALAEDEGLNPLSVSGIWAGFCGFLPGLFRHWPLPFRALKARRMSASGLRNRSGDVILGLVFAVPVLTVALMLLTSADEVFGSFMTGGLDAVMNMDASVIPKLILTLLLALGLFSRTIEAALKQRKETKTGPENRAISGLTVSVVLAALDLVYAAFAAVQIRYLFLGTESVRMAGGYASYARSGFFQLAALAFLTLLLIGPALSVRRENKPIRVLCSVTAVLTSVIDFSAFFRMRLYIEVYGLSLLRVLTLWAMAVILLSLLAVLIKAARPSRAVSPALTAVILATWVALNYANIDRIVAENQVARYNAGLAGWETVAELIHAWTPDDLPAYGGLGSEEAREKARTEIERAYGTGGDSINRPSAYDWSFSWTWAPETGKQ